MNMNQTIGFIGCGNMAKAMIGGILAAGLCPAERVWASNPSVESLDEMQKRYGIRTTQDNVEVAKQADILFLAVKPYLYEMVIAQLRQAVKAEAIIILIAAGQTIAVNEKRFGRPIKMVKAMPNTPAMVGEAMTAMSANSLLSQEEGWEIQSIFESFGKAEWVKESLMDVVAGVSGSSPAYVYLFIEALADGAVSRGMPRKQAYTFAAQAVLGSAKMVLETGLHPGALKDMVCSPGGTTIEAVAELEKAGMRSAVIEAVRACTDKSAEMAG